MAAHVICFKNEEEFNKRIEERDPELSLKMAKTLIHAQKHGKPKVDVFEVLLKDKKEIIFSVERKDYLNNLLNLMDVLIQIEEFELCSQIKEIEEKRDKRRKKKDI